MQMVRQWHINRIHIRVRQQRIIAVVNLQTGRKIRKPLGLGRITGRQRKQLRALGGMDRRAHLFACEIGSPKDAPTNWIGHVDLCSCVPSPLC